MKPIGIYPPVPGDPEVDESKPVANLNRIAWRNFAVFIGSLAVIGLAIVVTDNTQRRAARVQVDAAQREANSSIELAKGGVLLTLRDPDSARFQSVVYRQSPRGPTVCGFVNAKNGFGGYAGLKPFYMALGDVPKLQPGESAAEYYLRESFDQEFKSRCAGS
jgi:hypothetical protein